MLSRRRDGSFERVGQPPCPSIRKGLFVLPCLGTSLPAMCMYNPMGWNSFDGISFALVFLVPWVAFIPQMAFGY